jgi:imidazolonepropionase-like amidohydrolase
MEDGCVLWKSADGIYGALIKEALGMSDQIGLIEPGLKADIITLDGGPLKDIAAVYRVVFVSKAGVVYKNNAHRRG